MANQHRGESRIKIGTKNYTCSATFGDLAEIEDALDTGVMDLFQRNRQGKLKMIEVITLFRLIARDAKGEKPEQEIIEKWVAKVGVIPPITALTTFLTLAVAGGLKAGNVVAAKEK